MKDSSVRGSGDGEEEQPGATFPPYPPSSVYKGMGYGHLAPLVRGLRYVNASGALVDLDARRSPLEASAVRALGGSFGLMGPVVSVLLETRPLALVETRLKVVPQEAQESDEAFTEKILALRNECDNMLVRETLLIFLYGDQRSSGKGGGGQRPFFFTTLSVSVSFFSLSYMNIFIFALFFFFSSFSFPRVVSLMFYLFFVFFFFPSLSLRALVMSFPYRSTIEKQTKTLRRSSRSAASLLAARPSRSTRPSRGRGPTSSCARGAAGRTRRRCRSTTSWRSTGQEQWFLFFLFREAEAYSDDGGGRKKKKKNVLILFPLSLSSLPPSLNSLSLSLSLTGGGQS